VEVKLPKSPNPIDIHVGGRVRLRRMLIGMSQEKLGEHLGLTFQQVQKYEKGANRIGASRLYKIAEVLGVTVQYFYEDMPEIMDGDGENGFGEDEQQPFVMDFVNSPEGLQLNLAFQKISDSATRKRIVDLVRTLAADGQENGLAD
jgi:transcriptional regulator with XRE-family HTH domain